PLLLRSSYIPHASHHTDLHSFPTRRSSDLKAKTPVVIRTMIGAGFRAAAQHSQCLYNVFAHVPGLKVVVPATPYDAKGLLIQSIDRKSTRLNSSHVSISYAVFCLKKKKKQN